LGAKKLEQRSSVIMDNSTSCTATDIGRAMEEVIAAHMNWQDKK
jgi:hypothetical protein